MAHFVRMNENVCGEVVVVSNDVLENKEFPESEPIGIEFLKNLFGEDTDWKQTSYNRNFRGNYAQTGFIYDPELDIFYSNSQPFESWTLNPITGDWDPPVWPENNGIDQYWDEVTQSWNSF